jgi:SM-20-related protein
MFDLLLIDDFLDAESCVSIVDALRRSAGDPATVYGTSDAAAIETAVRRTARLAPPAAVRDLILRTLDERRAQVAQHFGVTLGPCEEPQFLRYREGDFFVAHQDGNTPLLRHTSGERAISVVLFLTAPASYGGGALVFHGAWPDLGERRSPVPRPGTLVAFRSETTHEVTPVTRGERYTIASWYLR